jgi:hypothetical protein
MTAHRFVCIGLLVNRLVAYRQLAGNLLGTPLQPEQRSHFNQDLIINVGRITASLRTLFTQILSLGGRYPRRPDPRATSRLTVDLWCPRIWDIAVCVCPAFISTYSDNVRFG